MRVQHLLRHSTFSVRWPSGHAGPRKVGRSATPRMAWRSGCGAGRWRAGTRPLLLEPLEQRQLLAAQPLITEFMASNRGTLNDGDGNSSDWIEIHNAGDAAVDLAGYRLTDDADQLDKWVLPSVELEPGGFLVVFASGQPTANYVDAGGYLHTDFKLGADGEYLALVAPDGSVVSQFGAARRTTRRS